LKKRNFQKFLGRFFLKFRRIRVIKDEAKINVSKFLENSELKNTQKYKTYIIFEKFILLIWNIYFSKIEQQKNF